jgi:hypothetical protein
MIKRRELLYLLSIVVWFQSFLLAAPKESVVSAPIKAYGTGMTTGHIADLEVKNKGKTALTILPQRVFIPSTGQFQPYIADIPAAIIQPGSTATLQLQGYCTDVHLPAAPAALELIPILKWIPIRHTDSTLVGNGTYLVTHNSVVPFTKDHISYIITSAAYTPLYPPPDTLNIVTWPGTDLPAGGKMNHISRPDLYATIMAKVLELLETGATAIQTGKKFPTPFTVDPDKEREAIIQQVIWMYASALAAKKYGKEEFRSKVYDQFKSRSSFSELPALEKKELDDGIDEFWNVFQTVATEAKLFESKEPLANIGALVDLPVDTIQYPWSMVSMIDIIMKPGFVKYIPVKVSDPTIPILAGAASIGSLLFIAFHDHTGDTTCTFSIALEATPSACSLANGTISLSTSIETDFAYVWSNGATTKDLIGVPPGNYSVTVTRTGTTCGQSAQATVENLNPPINTSFTSTDAHCGGQDGTATVSVDPPGLYSYAWSNGSVDQNQTNLVAGQYTLIVTASGTCADTNTITINDLPPSFSANITNTPAHCGEADGSVNADVSPAGDYQFLWSEGSTTNSVSGLLAGTYSVTVTENSTGCMLIEQTTLDVSAPAFQIDVSTTDASCGLSDGTASTTVDPPGEYSYTWSNGQTTENITGLAPGVYRVTVSVPGSGCADSVQITINQLPPSYVINISNTPASCGLTDGTASVSVDPPGAYEFNWSNGQSGSQVNGLAAGSYTVTVSLPGNLCVQTSAVSISLLPPSFSLAPGSTPASCGLEDGTATALVDPPGEYNYLWSNGQTTPQATGLAAGTYEVTVSIPGSACQQSLSITVDQLPPSFTITPSSTPVSCGLADGTGSVTPDPPGEYNYLWSNGQTTAQATGLAAGTYEVTVSIPGSACQQSLSITVDQLPPSFSINTSSTAAHCGLNDGTASAVVTPPGEYTFLWSDGQTTPQAVGLITGNYSVTVTLTGTSCQRDTIVTVDQLPASFTVNTTSTPAHCGLNDGTATAVVDPAGEYMYQWSGGQSGAQISGLAPGQYVVSVSLNGSSCFVTDTIAIDQLPLNLTPSFTITLADCGVANGGVTITIDPAGTYTYTWSNQQSGNALQQVPAGNYDVTVTDNNSCSATFSTSVGEKTAHYLDIISTSPATCLGGGEITFMLSSPGAGPLSVSITAPGGPVSLSLSPGSYLLSAFTNVVPGSYAFNVYDQSIGQACSDNQSAQVADQTPAIVVMNDVYTTQSDQPVSGNVLQNDSGLNLQLTSITNIIGGMVTFSANGSFTYTPNSGFSGSGSFTYTVTDACGNTAIGTASITVQMVACNFTITSTLTPANCDLENGAIAISVNQPGNYQYSWSNGQTGATISNIPAGSYSVTIHETGTGCTENFTLSLTEYPANYISNIIITQPAGMDPGEIKFTLNTQGGVPFLSVSVDHPNGLQTFTIEPGVVVLSDYVDIVPGSYTIEAFIGDAGPDCVDDFSATINTPPSVNRVQNVIFSLGVAIVNSPITLINKQPESASPNYWSTGIIGNMDYHVGKRPQHARIFYSPSYSDWHIHHPAWMQMEHLTELLALHQKWCAFSMNGGLGFRPRISTLDYDPAYFTLNAGTQFHVGNKLRVQAEVSMRGWTALEPPQWMINVYFPFLK